MELEMSSEFYWHNKILKTTLRPTQNMGIHQSGSCINICTKPCWASNQIWKLTVTTIKCPVLIYNHGCPKQNKKSNIQLTCVTMVLTFVLKGNRIAGVVASSCFHETQWFFEVFEIPEMKWTVVWFWNFLLKKPHTTDQQWRVLQKSNTSPPQLVGIY